MKIYKIKDANCSKSQNFIGNENEDVKEISAIRLSFASLEPFRSYATGELKIGQTYYFSTPFRLPKFMSIADACKVVSYLSDRVEVENDLVPVSKESVLMVSDILEDYGFSKIEGKDKISVHMVSDIGSSKKIEATYPFCGEIKGVADLFTVGGNFEVFKKSDLYDRYFNWYSAGVTEEEVLDIYKKVERVKEIVDNFQKNFQSMSYEEREAYLKESGFNFGTPDEEQLSKT